LVEFDELAKEKNKLLDDWKNEFEKLMKCIGAKNQTLISKRIEQLDIYEKLKNIKNILKVLIEIKEKHKLSGDFSFIENVKSSLESNDYSTKSIEAIEDETIKVYKQLENMSDKRLLNCLEKFNANYSFVEWIRKAAPGK
jgi:hypothetical protein